MTACAPERRDEEEGLAAAVATAGGKAVPVLEMRGVRKDYGPVTVLDGLDLSVMPGEVLALVGENGAGKSTLMRLAAGYARPTEGSVSILGRSLPADVRVAEEAGVVLVHQEFCLAPHLTVAENIFVGREPKRRWLLDYRRMNADAGALLAELGCAADPTARLADLPNTEWQITEIAKAFAGQPKLLLMDEPTAVLGAREVEALFDRVRSFTRAGGSVVFTSHRLDEVKAISDRVAVLRDGVIRHVGPAAALTEDAMAALMVGRPLNQLYPPKSAPAAEEVVLEVRGLVSLPAVRGVDLTLRRGEILGIAGLVGSGRTETFEAVAGLRAATCDSFTLGGRRLGNPPEAREAWRLGLAYLTEDRKGKGLLLGAGLAENVSLTIGALEGSTWIRPRQESARLADAVRDFDIRAGNARAAARSLSGGNQQKLLLAKTLASRPRIVVFDEPTRGVDIGSKQQIYRVIAALAAEGTACVVISSEMQEVIGLAHRVLVMRQGRVVGELTGERIEEEAIVRRAVGLEEDGEPPCPAP